jgi:hypothetical protein
MPSPAARSSAPSWRVIRLVHAAILAAALLYGVILVVVAHYEAWPGEVTRAPVPAEAVPGMTVEATGVTPDLIVLALPVAGLAALAIAAVMRRRMMPPIPTWARLSAVAVDESARSPASRAALRRYFSGALVSWVLCEVAVVLGLAAALITQQVWPFFAFAPPGIVGLLVWAPRRRDLHALLRVATQSDVG